MKKCACGCGATVNRTFKLGHHVRVMKTGRRFGTIPAWNKGLKKGDHPSLSKMGFQVGHKHFVSPEVQAEVTKKLIAFGDTHDFRLKKGHIPWNKGSKGYAWPKGNNHGNWNGAKGGIRNTSEYAKFRESVFKRDDWTCQNCKARNKEGLGKTVYLNVHHILPISTHYHLALSKENGVTLCEPCHFLTDSYGSKSQRIKKALNKSGN